MALPKTTLTAQDIFDAAARHIIKQGRASVRRTSGGGSSCLYRGPWGTACAVGGLLTDAQGRGLDKDRDGGSSVGNIISLLPERLREHEGILCSLQMAHDSAASTDEGRLRTSEEFMQIWRDQMRNVAVLHRLSAAVLDEAPT